MRVPKTLFAIVLTALLVTGSFSFPVQKENDVITDYIVDPQSQSVELFWKNDKGEILKSFDALKDHLRAKHKSLTFAMNAGMFTTEFAPLGLFIDKGETVTKLNTYSGNGNFYLKPNGVFYISNDNKAGIVVSEKFVADKKIKYATQSGPMLLVDGQIHSAFNKESKNLNIRNGVGILSDGKIVFAISKREINFYDFAMYFKELGCKNALYLDGFVSRMYLPEKNVEQMDGRFGVMIGVAKSDAK